jgi:tetratricopeptide (TPR) repeat protein
MSTISQFEPVTLAKTESGQAATDGPVPGQPRFLAWLLAALLGIVTLVLYWPATHYDYINFDDPDYVTSNRHVETGLTLSNVHWALITNHAANWHPLTWISLMMDVSLFGKNAGEMHFTNMLLHAANVVLLFLLLHRLTGAPWQSAVAAAFFGWHPVHVESVAWISERKDVLSTNVQGPAVRRNFYHSPTYWLAWFCFALGLMSKPMLVTFPFVMLLLDFWPLKRWRRDRLWPVVGEKIPFFALALAASVTTYLVQSGARVGEENLPLNQRVGNALISYCKYLSKLFWPKDLAVFYPHPGIWPTPDVLWALAFLTGITLLVLTQWRRYPCLLMGWLWYGGTLVPVIGLIQVGRQSMADRYTYIPSVGIAIMLVWGTIELLRRRRHAVTALSVMAGLALGICLFLTRQQLRYWQNSETLFRQTLMVTEDNFLAHFNLGVALEMNGRLDEAIHEYQETVRLQPSVAAVRNNLGAALIKKGRVDDGISQLRMALRLVPTYGLAHENLGNALLEQGHTNAAIKEYQEGVRLQPEDDAGPAHYNLGVALNQAGQTAAAIREFQEALIRQPDYTAAGKNLANLLGQTGQTNAAISELQEVLRLDPKDTDAHYNLANLFLNLGRPADAIGQFQADLRINPDDADAHYNLGKALLDQGQTDMAVSEFQAAFRLKKYDAEVHYNLGNLLAQKGQTDAAIAQFQETIRLQPKDADAHNNLGNLLAKEGQTEAAIRELQEALRLRPEDANTHYNLGYAFLKTGRFDDTIRQFQEAIRLKPNYAPAHYNLAVALNKKGQTDMAIGQFEEAIRLEPDYTIAHNGLGIALAAQGRIDEAVIQFQAALRIKPDYASAQNNLARARALEKPSPKR